VTLRIWTRFSRVWLATDYPICSVIFESSFQRSKQTVERLYCKISVQRDLRALSFELWEDFSNCHSKWERLKFSNVNSLVTVHSQFSNTMDFQDFYERFAATCARAEAAIAFPGVSQKCPRCYIEHTKWLECWRCEKFFSDLRLRVRVPKLLALYKAVASTMSTAAKEGTVLTKEVSMNDKRFRWVRDMNDERFRWVRDMNDERFHWVRDMNGQLSYWVSGR